MDRGEIQVATRAFELMLMRDRIVSILGGAYDGPTSHDEAVADRIVAAVTAMAVETQGHHRHVAGTAAGLDIDTCARCGRDLRDPLHHFGEQVSA